MAEHEMAPIIHFFQIISAATINEVRESYCVYSLTVPIFSN